MSRPERLLPPDTDIRAWLAGLDAATRRAAIDLLGEMERDALDRAWPLWGHPGQVPPAACADGAPWRTWVLTAGRGFGKTLAGAQWITAAVATRRKLAIALVGATLDEARRVMVEGRSGLLTVADAWIEEWQPSRRLLRFRTGAEARLFSGASPDQLRGPEHHLAWCDELAKWEKPQATWEMLQLGLRAGAWPRALVTTTPRPGPVLGAIMAEADCVTTGGRTRANPHLSAAWKQAVERRYAGTRLGRQELDGELLTDAPGALWTVELLERCRAQGSDWAPIARQRVEPASVGQPAPRSGDRTDVTDSLRDGPPSSFQRKLESPCLHPTAGPEEKGDPSVRWDDGPPQFTRLVIGVDPPTGDGTCGIVACAKDAEGRAHVLADHSVTGRSPEGWARAVADAARLWSSHALPLPVQIVAESNQGGSEQVALSPGHGCGRPGDAHICSRSGPSSRLAPTVEVVAEANQGGKMVRAVLHTADPALRVRLVNAHVGKAERAAPVAMLFEAGRVVLHGRFPALETEMLGMIAGGDFDPVGSGGRGGSGRSPDRADAMVWALTELMLGKERGTPRVLGL